MIESDFNFQHAIEPYTLLNIMIEPSLDIKKTFLSGSLTCESLERRIGIELLG